MRFSGVFPPPPTVLLLVEVRVEVEVECEVKVVVVRVYLTVSTRLPTFRISSSSSLSLSVISPYRPSLKVIQLMVYKYPKFLAKGSLAFWLENLDSKPHNVLIKRGTRGESNTLVPKVFIYFFYHILFFSASFPAWEPQ